MRFVLLDAILELEPGRSAVARKVFASDDDYLADHFPGYPVVPGVLVTEAIGQTGGWLLLHHLGFERLVLLVMIEHAKFRRPVTPGEELRLEAALDPGGEQTFTARGRALVDGKVVAEARLAYRAFPLPDDPVAAERLRAWAKLTWQRLRTPAP